MKNGLTLYNILDEHQGMLIQLEEMEGEVTPLKTPMTKKKDKIKETPSEETATVLPLTAETEQEVKEPAPFVNEVFHQEGGIRITKAKITQHDSLEVTYQEVMADKSHAEVTKKCDNIVHKDLKNAFSELELHLVIICEQAHANDAKSVLRHDLPFMDSGNYSVNGFSIGGDGESEGITLIGCKNLTGGKVLNLTSPFQKWTDEYEFASQFGEAMERAIYEVKEYLTGKSALKQAEMDFNE